MKRLLLAPLLLTLLTGCQGGQSQEEICVDYRRQTVVTRGLSIGAGLYAWEAEIDYEKELRFGKKLKANFKELEAIEKSVNTGILKRKEGGKDLYIQNKEYCQNLLGRLLWQDIKPIYK